MDALIVSFFLFSPLSYFSKKQKDEKSYSYVVMMMQ